MVEPDLDDRGVNSSIRGLSLLKRSPTDDLTSLPMPAPRAFGFGRRRSQGEMSGRRRASSGAQVPKKGLKVPVRTDDIDLPIWATDGLRQCHVGDGSQWGQHVGTP